MQTLLISANLKPHDIERKQFHVPNVNNSKYLKVHCVTFDSTYVLNANHFVYALDQYSIKL